MDKSNNITIDGKQINIIYNVDAAEALYNASGHPNIMIWLAEYLKENEADAEEESEIEIVEAKQKEEDKQKKTNLAVATSRICTAIEIMANASIKKHNFEIALGLSNDKKKSFYPENYFKSVITAVETMELFKIVMNTVMKGVSFKIPEEFEIDKDYLAIEAAKKN